MSDALKYLKEIKDQQLKINKTRIDTVKSMKVPQHILATKEIAEELITDNEKEGFIHTEIGFCFKERLVNKLMHLAYLNGKESSNNKGFQEGYIKAIEVMQKKLDEV